MDTNITEQRVRDIVNEILRATIKQSDLLPQSVKQRHIEATIIFRGLDADRPDGTTQVLAYFATDTNALYIWDGTAWVGYGPTLPWLVVTEAQITSLSNLIVVKNDTNIQGIDTLKGFNDLKLQVSGSTGTNKLIKFVNDVGVVRGYFDTRFTANTGAYNASNLTGAPTTLSCNATGDIIRTPSDQRLKKNVVALADSIEKIMQLRGVTFEWDNPDVYGQGLQYGMIAQEVEEIIPELIADAGSGDNLKSINYLGLIPLLIEVVKNQEERIRTLEGRV